VPPSSPAWSDWLTQPLLPAAAGVAVALLGLLAWVRRRQQQAGPGGQAEAAAGAAAIMAGSGQSVDTSKQAAPLSSMMFSPSQLEAAGEVDPLAEADVYLAYGRDQQAEEILRDALRSQPNQLALHLKLLEIHALRQDRDAYAASATRVHALTQGKGPDWAAVSTQGRQLDPDNPLYRPAAGQLPPQPAAAPTGVAPGTETGRSSEPPTPLPELDLQLAPEAKAPAVSEPAAAAPSTLDFVLTLSSPPSAANGASAPAASESVDFDLDLAAFEQAAGAAAPATSLPGQASAAAARFSELPLDFRPTQQDEAEAQPKDFSPTLPADPSVPDIEVSEASLGGDPMETKLALASEFLALGDAEGARMLAEDVAKKATGDLQSRARALLARLG
jgi:pilus assembly protein FimV